MVKQIYENFDVIILGSGIVGVSTAWHLQRKGKKVALIDTGQPGHGASFGNAGLIERSSVIPYHFPRRLKELLRYSLNRQSAMRYDWSYLLRIAPWLYQFWRHSTPARLEIAARDMLGLIECSLDDHDTMIMAAGLQHLRQCRGWIEIFRHKQDFVRAKTEHANLDSYHLNSEILEIQALRQREPSLGNSLAGAIHWLDPHTITAPDLLVEGYARHFCTQGGALHQADAYDAIHNQNNNCWQLTTQSQKIMAKNMVVALGWESGAWLEKFVGLSIPLRVKRGYHMHYQPEGDMPNHPLCDSQAGFVLAPMQRGLRLTTGIEFADPNKPENDIQLRRAEIIARKYYPLGTRIDKKIWLGRRPCLPDMRPVIGAVDHSLGLWANFGHAHHGLTLGPVSGRLLTQMIIGEKSDIALEAFSMQRFAR